MLRVFIVDDELVVRVGIKSMIDWNSHGFEVVGEAADGEEALLKIPQVKPHIVMTDIKMPRMDGIELIKKLQESYSHIKVLVLSCHNDFEYVKQSMKLGAVDYILKLSMRREELLDVMENIKKQINEDVEKTSYVNSLQRKIDYNMDVIKEKFFKKLMNSSSVNSRDLFNEAEDLGLRFYDGNYLILVTNIHKHVKNQKEERPEPELLRHAILSIMEEAIPKQLAGEAFAYNNDDFLMVFTFERSIDCFSKVSDQIKSFIRHMHELLWVYLNACVFTSIHDVIIEGIENLHDGFKKAMEAAEHKFYFNESKVIYSSGINYCRSVHEYFDSDVQKRIYGGLEVGDFENVIKCIGEMLDTVRTEKKLSPSNVRRLGRIIIATICQVIRTHNIVDDNGEPLDFDIKADEIEEIKDIYMMQNWVEECITEFSGYYYKNLKGAYTEEIKKLIQFIGSNYDKDISLEQAAGFLNVGKNYFCSIFKRETGQTFNDYFINVKIEKAKELLRTTNLKNYEVALRVGYNNFNYFSTVFKKVAGMSPSEFRKKVSM